ncbi:MAG: HAMP domain-containing sensor histidine kinase [Bdellovibrionota bacterium]
MSKNSASHSRSKYRLGFAVGWLVFVTSMVVWWWLFGLSEIESSASLMGQEVAAVKYRMLLWEGVIFLAAIVIGGLAFLYFVYKDDERHQQLRNFFSIFTHDIKTSIARLRLQADLLREEPADKLSEKSRKLLFRLASDINRLDLQLENALFISQNPKDILLPEKFLLSQALERIRPDWENLELKVERKALVYADQRAFTSCLRNLIQNSVLHGHAELVVLKPQSIKPGVLEIIIEDNGKGFSGDYSQLGSAVLSDSETSGNGIGLYLSRTIIEKMGGNLVFEKGDAGFRSRLRIPGDLV